MGRMRLDLRAQLALQVAIGVASLVVMVLLLRAYVMQEEIDRTARGRLAVGQVLSNYVDAQLADQLQELARAAARMQGGTSSGAAPLLEDLRSRLDQTAYGVFLLGPDGSPIAADPPDVGAIGAEIVRRPEVADALAQGRAAVSGVHAGPSGRVQVGMAVPARIPWLADPRTGATPAIGTIGVVIDPSNPRFAELVESARSLGGKTSAEVVDQFGVVVASSLRERTLLPGRFPDFYATHLSRREPGTGLTQPSEGPDGSERHLVAFVPLRVAPWGLALGGPESEVLAPIRRWDPPLVGLTLASLLVLIGLATLTARSVIDPVRALIAAARRIARGDVTTEVPGAGGGELHQLSTALEEMRRDLRRAELARAEVDRLKDEFVSSVSHELRTPLGYIKGYTTTLLRRDTSWDERSVRKFLKIIDESSDQLEELVDHLLDMSRISEGRLEISPAPVQLAALAREVARRTGARSGAHRILVDVPPDVPPVMADRARITQVFGNLLDNAIKYSPEGGTITISVEVEAERAVVAVRDEGIGIPEDQLAAVFDRFHRGANPLVRTIRGTGLGLPICKGIVEAHGGSIWAEPAPDRGAIVRFTLPLASRGPAPTASGEPRRAPRRRTQRVPGVRTRARVAESPIDPGSGASGEGS